ncbi:dipeptidyl peptidase III [Aspergillus steynii IBT 23096]|uniref:Dipeptidyl peptidase 3 n=1 Tax=Aspergillus steynii IBT 23096 TaxID=1392250 RepID=A0A2I2G098_9EURO|nr:dipeptidyl peptidase III [Aspergillus steynii IBT 23096]PLB46256.1 dipeptidyl peptidase III [Aspergillus steynii IBT 23096]
MAAPQIYALSVAAAFRGLDRQQQLYAHHMAKAAWNGTRIILRQVSPEANDIFDFIMALYRDCDGVWERTTERGIVQPHELQNFLDYAAMFLSNVGNYFGSGDQKFTPDISEESLARLASFSPKASDLLQRVKVPMLAKLPSSLGVPGPLTQSTYYLGDNVLASSDDIAAISKFMEEAEILPENTRLKRNKDTEEYAYDILQASIEHDEFIFQGRGFLPGVGRRIRLAQGDHRNELRLIYDCLQEAKQFSSNAVQKDMLEELIDSFHSGKLQTYKEAQKIWVKDKAPPVETVLGFVEPYRDPLGVRAEFEGIVGIPDPAETRILAGLASKADAFVYKLPWVEQNERKGPFEKHLFEPPDFSSIQSLAYNSSIIFPGINLPNYNDIRQEVGYKNIIFSNRMVAERVRTRGLHMVEEAEQETFKSHRFHSYYIWVVLHEILGHGTGRFLTEDTAGNFNFDHKSPPLNPLTQEPINCWYRPGQTWTGVFQDLSTTVDECRAEIVGAYLLDEPEILEIFGYTENSEIKPKDVIYNMYLQLGVDGLRGLENYDPVTKKWGQAHSRAHYAIFRHLLRDSDGLFTVACDTANKKLTVKIDGANVLQKGKPSLGRMLMSLHVYRCTADIENCRALYEDLSTVDEEALRWRDVVISRKDPPLAFCQANTFLGGDTVSIKEYEPSARGVVQSWAERGIL